MKILTKFIIIQAILILFTATNNSKAYCASTVIEKYGYHVALKWRKTGNKLKVEGFIRDGKVCKKMDIALHMINKKDNGAAYIRKSINYHTTNGLKFKGEDDCYTSGMVSSNKNWFVGSLSIDCKN